MERRLSIYMLPQALSMVGSFRDMMGRQKAGTVLKLCTCAVGPPPRDMHVQSLPPSACSLHVLPEVI